MKPDFIEKILQILDTYFSDEQIIGSMKSLDKRSKNEIYVILKNYFKSEQVEKSTKDNKLASWIQRFLNSDIGEDIELEKFELFFTEIEKLFRSNGFRIENMSHFDINYHVSTPEDIEREEERYKEMLDSEGEDPYQKEYEESTKKESVLALKYQNLLTDLYINIQEYIILMRKYINKEDILINPKDEKEFKIFTDNIKSRIATLSFVFPSFQSYKYELYIRIPFSSLYSIKKDWSEAVLKEQKKDLFSESIIKDEEKILNIDTVRNLVIPIEKNIIKNLTEDSFDEISNYLKTSNQHIEVQNPVNKNIARYDFENSILYINQDYFEFKIDGNEDKILRIIFERPNDTHIFKKMIIPFNVEDKDNITSKTIIDIIGRIKNKLNQEDFDDFLIQPRRGTVKINPLYEIS